MSSPINSSSPAVMPVVSAGEQSEPQRMYGITAGTPAQPDPEVHHSPARRLFSAAYKQRILAECDGAAQPGQVGHILRREGLFSFHLRDWRAARQRNETAVLASQPRGPKPTRPTALEQELKRFQRENRRLQQKLKQAELIIDLQKKVSELLGVTLPTTPTDETNETN